MRRLLKNLSPFQYTIYAIFGTIVELSVVAAIGLWLIPQLWDFHIPPFALGIIMAGLLSWSIYTYITGRRALLRKPLVDPQSIVGTEGTVVSPLRPKGYIKINGVLWRATSEAKIKVGSEVIVTGIDGLKLSVVRKEEPLRSKDKDTIVLP